MTMLEEVFGHKMSSFLNTSSDKIISDSCVGIEVELQRMAMARDNATLCYWNPVTDGSLRNRGLEYVLIAPMFGADIVAATEELESFVSAFVERKKISQSTLLDDNTSVHVHVDCRDMKDAALKMFILMALLMEQVLFSYASPERENNVFCVSAIKADQEVPRVGRIAYALGQEGIGIYDALSESSKYASVNLRALATFGSIEFRAHRGEYKQERLIEWVNILLSLKEAAINTTYSPDTLLVAAQSDPVGLVEELFGTMSDAVIRASTARDVTIGSKLLAEALYLHDSLSNRVAARLTAPADGSLLSKYKKVEDLYPSDAPDGTLPLPDEAFSIPEGAGYTNHNTTGTPRLRPETVDGFQTWLASNAASVDFEDDEEEEV